MVKSTYVRTKPNIKLLCFVPFISLLTVHRNLHVSLLLENITFFSFFTAFLCMHACTFRSVSFLPYFPSASICVSLSSSSMVAITFIGGLLVTAMNLSGVTSVANLIICDLAITNRLATSSDLREGTVEWLWKEEGRSGLGFRV